ncbi:MAG: SRPBCC family protein [Microthrixaceae bacterium]
MTAPDRPPAAGDDDPLLSMEVEVTEHLAAPIGEVWALLSDVERMAGLGPEHTHALWDATGGPAVGSTFHGTNRIGDMEWTVECTVVECDPPRRIAWTVLDPAEPSSTWSYDLVPDGDGTSVTQRFRHGPGFSYLRARVDHRPERASEFIEGRAAMLRTNMSATLRAAGEVLAVDGDLS